MKTAEIGPLLEQAGQAAELLGDERLAARVSVENAWIVVHTTAERWSDAALLAQVDRAIEVFERHGDDVAVARALEVVTHAHLYHGRLSRSPTPRSAGIATPSARTTSSCRGSIAWVGRSPTNGARPRSTGSTTCSRKISTGLAGREASGWRPARRCDSG